MNSSPSPDNNIIEAFHTQRTWLTYAILVFNVVVFLVMLKASLYPLQRTLLAGNDYATLVNFGAKTNPLVFQQKQWFRLVTPIFIHVGLLHLLTNAYALWIVGPITERLYGSAQFALLYLLSGIGGFVGSLLGSTNPLSPSAGSSGALFGLLGVLLVVSYKSRQKLTEPFRKALRKGVLIIITTNFAFGILNNSGRLFGDRVNSVFHVVDNWGHVGGLLTGAILAMILPYLAPEKKYASWLDKFILAGFGVIVSYCFLRAYQLRPYLLQR